MAPQDTGFFAGFDIENGGDLRNLYRFLGLDTPHLPTVPEYGHGDAAPGGGEDRDEGEEEDIIASPLMNKKKTATGLNPHDKLEAKEDRSPTGYKSAKHIWLISEHDMLLSLLCEQVKRYRKILFIRHINGYNALVFFSDVQQDPKEVLINTRNHESLARTSTAPWRTVAALNKMVKSLTEYKAIRVSSLSYGGNEEGDPEIDRVLELLM